MFYGIDNHTTDVKGRVFIPVRYRKYLTETFYLMHEKEKCVRIYTAESWGKFCEKLSALPRSAEKLRHAIYQSVFETELDSSGRILIPDVLRKYAGITKNVTVIGMDDRIEIWDDNAYTEYMGDMTDEKTAEELDDYLS